MHLARCGTLRPGEIAHYLRRISCRASAPGGGRPRFLPHRGGQGAPLPGDWAPPQGSNLADDLLAGYMPSGKKDSPERVSCR